MYDRIINPTDQSAVDKREAPVLSARLAPRPQLQ